MSPPTDPTTWDDLVSRLVELRAERGSPSFGELAIRIGDLRRQRGRAHAQPGRTTVYDLFRPGRRRVDGELLLDAVAALGVDPEGLQEWRRLMRSLGGEGDEGGGSAGSGSGDSTGDIARARRGLPHWDGPFTGRAPTLTAMNAQLRPKGAVMALSGLGGSGKSRTASRFLTELLESRRIASTVWVDLRGHDPDLPPVSAEAAARAALDALDVHLPAGARASTTLRQQLATGSIGLLLDDAESVEQVEDLMPWGGASVVVLTTRRRPRHPRVPVVVLGGLDEEDARALLVDRLGRERVESDPAAADRLIGLGGGLPLGMELLAARAAARATWSLADLADQAAHLRAGLRLERPLAAAVAAAYESCSEPARVLLRQLASQPCSTLDVETAAELGELEVDRAAQLLDELGRSHLVDGVAAARAPRVSMHDVVRTYALEAAALLDRPSAREATLDRLCRHLLGRLWQCRDLIAPDGLPLEEPAHEQVLLRPEPRSGGGDLAWLEENADALLELVAACVESRPRVSVSATPLLSAWLHSRWRLGDAAWLLDQARRAADRWGEPRAVAQVRYTRGMALTWTAAPAEALEDLAAAEEALGVLGRPADRATVVGAQSLTNRYAGELETAVDQALEAVSLLPDGSAERVHRWWTAITCQTLLGRTGEADALEAAIPAEDLDGSDERSFHHLYRAEDLLLRRRWTDALRAAEEGVRSLEDRRPPTSTLRAYAGVVLAGARIHTGSAAEAEAALAGAVATTRAAGDQQLEIFVHTLHGEALVVLDRPHEAVAALERGRELAIRLANLVAEAELLEVLGRAADRLHRPVEACTHRAEAAALWAVMGSTRGADLGLDESCA